ncbi:MAG: hypothetical protein KF741_09295 [Ferruginibacter sp.]|nr:hypothetical protein [Bacteroidota bacterium]MBX2919425.1 hypothetical protein [Ferruginibacter sp.]MCB0710147.1 hypothetical protein [Chitinophagaceae bacterium]MCC7379726.1 hypothetical protein [Chitinophagaceae bacterium]
MIKDIREQFNAAFTKEKYDAYMQKIEALHPGSLDFRNAETPVFIPADFTAKMLGACEDIIDVLVDARFNKMTERGIPGNVKVPGETAHPEFLVFDFGICEDGKGGYEPQLIEMQGFPTLFAFQVFHSALTAEYANLPANFSAYLNGYDKDSYTSLLKEIIVGDMNPENVILLEIFPEKQKTRIDFYCTEQLLGIKMVCLTKLIAEGNKLFYMNNGIKTPVKRIYNRLIFDDLQKQEGLGQVVDLTKPYDVEWVPHPNWFYRISKFTLPFINNQYVPQTYFLNELKQMPTDLENYVLKPLFSFAGMGVVIDVSLADLEAVKDPENWILQKKVKYADVIKTPDGPAKAEIRLFFFWKKGWNRPIAVHNLARLSKGKMIGTRYNKDKEWVGGSVAFFEKG